MIAVRRIVPSLRVGASAVEGRTGHRAARRFTLEELRQRAGVPLRALWVERGSRRIFMAAEQVSGWSLHEYRAIERSLHPASAAWHAREVPPSTERIAVVLEPNDLQTDAVASAEVSDAVWALQRLALRNVFIEAQIDSSAAPDSMRARHLGGLRQLRDAADSTGMAVPVVELRDSVRRAARRRPSPIPHDQIDLVLTPLRPAARRSGAAPVSPTPFIP